MSEEDKDDAAPAPGEGAWPTASRPTDRAQPPDGEELGRRVEAALLTSDRALPAGKLAEVLSVGSKAVQEAVAALNELYEKTGRSFRIEQVAGGWQVRTLPQYAEVLTSLTQSRSQSRLSPAALETLAIIAYRQPILRADIESIRGVACGEVLRSLMDRRLVKIVGRAEEIGRPMLYGTTKAFLEVFGLASLKDLPKAEELKAGRSAATPANTDEPSTT